MKPSCRVALSCLTVLAACAPRVARADVSSWLLVGGGVGQELGPSGAGTRPVLALETGMGSSPAAAFALGGVLRSHVHFGDGTNLALLLRGASGGYVNGDWGFALDAGPALRTYREGSWGGVAAVNLGAPWGIVLQLGGALHRREERSLSLVLGVDLARLTVYRTTGGAWWPNTFPAVRPASEPR